MSRRWAPCCSSAEWTCNGWCFPWLIATGCTLHFHFSFIHIRIGRTVQENGQDTRSTVKWGV